MAVQKEVGASGPDGRSKTVLLVDAAQQTGRRRLAPVWAFKTCSHPLEKTMSELVLQ